jgi:NADH-quinone oxidoreductase subunit C
MPNPMIGDERMEVAKVRERFGPILIKTKEFRGETYLCVAREPVVDVLRFLKEDPDLAYDYFCECVGVDYSAWPHERDLEGRFEVVYNLMSTRHFSRIFVKVAADDGQTVPTVKHVFAGAEYPEREIQDLFGVIFRGNEPRPGMRFLLPDDWVGFPLRKEFPLGGEDVLFAQGTYGPAVEDVSMPHAGESFEGKTGSEDVSGR